MLSQQSFIDKLKPIRNGTGGPVMGDPRRAPPNHHKKPLVNHVFVIDSSILFGMAIGFG